MASYLGFILPISPWGAAVSCLVWVAVNRIVRIPFIASFFMILTLGGAAIAANGGQVVSIAGTMAIVLLIVFSHKGNILSLIKARKK